MIRILVLIEYYLPGFKSGGPQRTLENLVNALGDEFSFKVLTRDRDVAESTPYPGIDLHSWNPVGKTKVFYIPVHNLSFKTIHRLITRTDHDILYVNSVFSLPFAIKPLILKRFGLLPKVPLILRPRGELSAGAVAIKRLKKRLYLAAAKMIGLYQGITWHASTKHEESDIRRYFGPTVPVFIAPNISLSTGEAPRSEQPRIKTKGHLNIVFVSRISEKKTWTAPSRCWTNSPARSK